MGSDNPGLTGFPELKIDHNSEDVRAHNQGVTCSKNVTDSGMLL